LQYHLPQIHKAADFPIFGDVEMSDDREEDKRVAQYARKLRLQKTTAGIGLGLALLLMGLSHLFLSDNVRNRIEVELFLAFLAFLFVCGLVSKWFKKRRLESASNTSRPHSD
jgi:hypothetical protein